MLNSQFPGRKPEPLALTLLTGLTALLSSLLLAFVFVTPVLAFGDADAERHEQARSQREQPAVPARAASQARGAEELAQAQRARQQRYERGSRLGLKG